MYSYLKFENVVAYLCNRQIYCGQTLNLEYVNISMIYNIKEEGKKNLIEKRRKNEYDTKKGAELFQKMA